MAEGDETVILTGGVSGLTSGTATLTITDDDPAPTAVTLSLNPAAVGESAAATAVTVTASLNNSPLPGPTTVTVSRTGGTATSATDYPTISDFTVTIPAEQTSGTATLSFDPTGDNLYGGRRDGDSHRQRVRADLWHGDADHHGRRHGADGNNAFAQPGCRGRECHGYDGDGYRLAEQLTAADSDHGDREQDGWYGHLGHGLPDDQRFHGDDSGGSDQWDGGRCPSIRAGTTWRRETRR